MKSAAADNRRGDPNVSVGGSVDSPWFEGQSPNLEQLNRLVDDSRDPLDKDAPPAQPVMLETVSFEGEHRSFRSFVEPRTRCCAEDDVVLKEGEVDWQNHRKRLEADCDASHVDTSEEVRAFVGRQYLQPGWVHHPTMLDQMIDD